MMQLSAILFLAGVFAAPAPSPVDNSRDIFANSTSGQMISGPQFVAIPPNFRPIQTNSEVVSTDMNNMQTNQRFNVGDGPIVAILPAGSNMTATWSLAGKGQPTIGFAPFFPSTQSSILLPVVEVNSTPTTTTSTSIMSTTVLVGTTMVNVPVILPVGIVDTTDQRNFSAQSAVPVLVSSASNVTLVPVVQQEIVQQNHRFEIQLIDFQWNNSAQTNINQNIMLSVKITADALSPASAIAQNITLSDMTPVVVNRSPVMLSPAETTSDLQQVFNGTYLTSQDNKVHVTRTITQDLCGQIPDRALLTVVVAPLTAADSNTFQQQSYTCVINLNFPTAVRSSESFWSDIMQCNSGAINGYSFRLWYKIRQYNIDWTDCQQNRPFPVVVSA